MAGTAGFGRSRSFGAGTELDGGRRGLSGVSRDDRAPRRPLGVGADARRLGAAPALRGGGGPAARGGGAAGAVLEREERRAFQTRASAQGAGGQVVGGAVRVRCRRR